MSNVAVLEPPKSVTRDMAERYGMEAANFEQTLKATVFPKDGTKEQFATFLLVAKQYDLNPFTKEIYAFPAKGGGIVPVVSIDGWIKLINNHPQFDGMEFCDEHKADGELISVTCLIYRKDRSKPVKVTEYLAECFRSTDPWKMKHRMLRHKSVIQAARYAFGFSGIYDPDEAERIKEAKERDYSSKPAFIKHAPPPPPAAPVKPIPFNFETFKANLDKATTTDEANDVYDALVKNRIPPLTEDEEHECLLMVAERVDEFHINQYQGV